MNQEDFWFRLCCINGVYHMQIRDLIEEFKAPEEIFKASENAVLEACHKHPDSFNRAIVDNILKERKDTSILSRRDIWENKGIRFISIDNPEFPEKMKVLPDTPYALYVRGSLPSDNEPLLGMVGARACSEYGKKMARKIGGEAAKLGISVVSGMARGIDSISASGALSYGGRTYAVLGCGADVIYPPENVELYYQIILNGGIISEYRPGTEPIGWQFPYRNRIISGLSDILLVIEAGKRSGTLSTARHALAQNRDIYALPGRATDPMSVGCNGLIADGAGIYRNTGDIASQILVMHDKTPIMQVSSSKNKKKIYRGDHVPLPVCKNKRWLKVYNSIGSDPIDSSEIIRKSDMCDEEALEIISELDINGYIREISKDVFVISDFS